jgi:hypothetical protein
MSHIIIHRKDEDEQLIKYDRTQYLLGLGFRGSVPVNSMEHSSFSWQQLLLALSNLDCLLYRHQVCVFSLSDPTRL